MAGDGQSDNEMLLSSSRNIERTFQFLLKHSSLFVTRLPLFVCRSRSSIVDKTFLRSFFRSSDVHMLLLMVMSWNVWYLRISGHFNSTIHNLKKTYYYEEHFPANGNVCGKFAGVEDGNNTRHRTLSKESRRGMCKILNWRITSNWNARFCWI